MMLGVLFVVALAGAAMGDDAVKGVRDCCSAEDRKEIQFVWKKVWSSAFTDRKVSIAQAVFDALFKRYPEAKALFSRVHVDDPNSGDWRAHLVRVANGIDTVINLVDDPDVLTEHLNHLAKQHEARAGVKATYFTAMGDAFEAILPQVSSCFNVDAWNRCFRRFADTISANLH